MTLLVGVRGALRMACPVYPLILLVMVLTTSFLGCSSDPANPVGGDLVDTSIDSLLQTVELVAVTQHAHLDIDNESTRPDTAEVLYFGESEGESSAILANYDFSALSDTLLIDALVHPDSIDAVYIRLYVLLAYDTLRNEDSVVVKKSFAVHQLSSPFDTLAVPGTLPPYDEELLNENSLSATDFVKSAIKIDIKENAFIDWYNARQEVGVVFREDLSADIDSCFIGIASREMKHAASSIDSLREGTLLGPVLTVDLTRDRVVRIQPVADASTLELETPPLDPADGWLLRTLDRVAPVLSFDLSLLPANILINRAELTIVNDRERSYGTPGSIVLSEIDTTLIPDPVSAVSLAALEAALEQSTVYQITGRSSVDVRSEDFNPTMEFNVTASVQRFVNGVYEAQRGFLLSAGESFFTEYTEGTLGPDFYLRKFRFHGTDAADPELWPRLRITYTRVDDITGGGK